MTVALHSVSGRDVPGRGRTVTTALLALVLSVTTACGASSGRSSAGGPGDEGAAVPTPERLAPEVDLYEPPTPLPDGPPGTLLRYQALRTDLPTGGAWRVLYLSRPDEHLRAVSGMVLVPRGEAPDGGWPVVAWAHPTDGVADRCAPSRDGPGTIIGARALLRDGFVVAATDFEGLGTPGPHPYLDGVSAGRTLIDVARAADDLPGVTTSGTVEFWGYSQGGQAAVFAAQQAPDHAPELEVEGTVAAAPAADLVRLAGGDDGRSPLPQVTLAMIGSWSADRDLDPTELLSPDAVAAVDRLSRTCRLTQLVGSLDGPLVLDPPTTEVAPWPELLRRSTPGHQRATGPVLLVQGGRDRIIDPASTADLFRRLCRAGSLVELRRFPGRGHGVAGVVSDQITAWLRHRHEGLPARDECAG